MRVSRLAIGLILGCAAVGVSSAHAETGAEAFARGKALLVEADFQGALQAYLAAARADQDKMEYRQQFMLLRQVVMLRQRLATEKNAQNWAYIAEALRSYYTREGIHSEALAVDEQLHARLGTARSAAMLAQTQLAMNRNADAAAVLGELDAAKATPQTYALLTVALARQGKMDEAGAAVAKIRLSGESGPGTLYSAARAHAAIGNAAEALALLRRCLESIPPSGLDSVKAHARACPDFATLASTPGFVAVMQTESKVPESPCSGGKSCAGCPMKGKCPKSQGQ